VAAGGEGGLVLLVDGHRMFIPATVALKVARVPTVTRVPGAPPELLGIALHEGAVVPIIALGAARSAMVVCSFAGEKVGLVGGDVVETGLCDTTGTRVVDLASTFAKIQAGGWSSGWRS
jgi:purine-binding chemotaxis protein CheW